MVSGCSSIFDDGELTLILTRDMMKVVSEYPLRNSRKNAKETVRVIAER